MITTKQRSALSAMAQKLDPIYQIGKNGIADTIIKELGDALEARELIKVSILKNSDLEAKDVLNELCEKLQAEPISCIGFKIVFYRESSRKNFKHIEF